MLKLTTTKRKLLGALETGTLTIEVSGRAPLEFKVLSLDPPFVLGKPVHYVPGHVDVEADVVPEADTLAGAIPLDHGRGRGFDLGIRESI